MQRIKTGRRFNVLLIALVPLSTLVAGCGGSSGPSATQQTGPTAVLFVAAPPKSLAVNASVALLAAATYAAGVTGGNPAVTWSVKCAATACGTFGANANAGATTYVAPAVIPTGTTVTVTATAVADSTKTASAVITIVAPIPIVVGLYSAAPASLQVGAAFTFTASVTNDVSANPEVTWSVTCESTACGSFNPTSTPSGTGTVYTAPAAVPAGGSVRVIATSKTDSTKSIAVPIVITAAAGTLANGTYVFQVLGSPGPQAAFVTGAFVANGGKISGGEQDTITYTTDVNGNLANATEFLTITGGRYAAGSDGNLVISIDLGANSVETLVGTVAGAGSQGFVGALNGAPVNGTLELQSSLATPARGYAISLSGGDQMGAPMWLAGVLNVDGSGTISGAGSELDVVDGQSIASGAYALAPGTVSAPDRYGRTQIQLLQPASSMLPPIYLSGYVVDAAHVRLIQTTGSGINGSFQGVLCGGALGQGGSTGQFSDASMAGTSYVFAMQGEDTRGALQVAGVLTANADGSVSGRLNWNDLSGTAAQSPLAVAGSYSIDAAGRVTLTQLTDGATFNYSLHGYLASSGNLLLLSNDSNDALAGQGFQQQASALTGGAFSGTYGLNAAVIPSTSTPTPLVGSLTTTVAGANISVSGFADLGTGGPDFALTGSFAASTGGILAGTLTGINPTSATAAGNHLSLYVVDSVRAVVIETDSNQLALGYLQSAP